MVAAPKLLVVGPSLHPVGEARIAVVAAVTAVDRHGVDDRVLVPSAVGHAGAAQVVVGAAPSLLHLRPAVVPVGQASVAVIVLAVVLDSDIVDLVVVHNVRGRRHRDLHDVALAGDVHGVRLLDGNHLGWLRHRVGDVLVDGHMVNHGWSRNRHVHVVGRARDVVDLLDVVDDGRRSRLVHRHRHVDLLDLRHMVVDVAVHDFFGAVHLLFVAAPPLMLSRPHLVCAICPVETVEVLVGHNDVLGVDDGRRASHLHLDVVVHGHMPHHSVVVTAHYDLGCLSHRVCTADAAGRAAIGGGRDRSRGSHGELLAAYDARIVIGWAAGLSREKGPHLADEQEQREEKQQQQPEPAQWAAPVVVLGDRLLGVAAHACTDLHHLGLHVPLARAHVLDALLLAVRVLLVEHFEEVLAYRRHGLG
mmetsp:Transcript_8063/g.14063  ORF Transcript_8063/g.14063 Transcript_8063/m.14063 type:complete len:418 (-) Transcript_8063:45-1298(-)